VKRLLIVYPGTGGTTDLLAEAAIRGARGIDEIETLVKLAREATAEDVLNCGGLLLGTPEKFGYMAGLMKDFLERIFYACEGKVEGLPYALFVSAGNDGTGAVTSVERIVTGLRLKKIHEPMVAKGAPNAEALAQCEELGATMAAGIAYSMF
jgi:multimeric flavodoxin WrbA